MPDPEQTPGPRRQERVRRLARPMGVASGYSLSAAGTGMLLVFAAATGTVLGLAATAWLRHRPASRASQRAAQVAGAAAAGLAS